MYDQILAESWFQTRAIGSKKALKKVQSRAGLICNQSYCVMGSRMIDV